MHRANFSGIKYEKRLKKGVKMALFLFLTQENLEK